jgi:hypothetical protein
MATSRVVLLPPPLHPRLIIWFLNNLVSTVWGYPHAQPQTWRTRVSLCFWLLPLDLFGIGGLISSYATAGIALDVSGTLKPHHHDTVYIRVKSILMTRSVISLIPPRTFTKITFRMLWDYQISITWEIRSHSQR